MMSITINMTFWELLQLCDGDHDKARLAIGIHNQDTFVDIKSTSPCTVALSSLVAVGITNLRIHAREPHGYGLAKGPHLDKPVGIAWQNGGSDKWYFADMNSAVSASVLPRAVYVGVVPGPEGSEWVKSAKQLAFDSDRFVDVIGNKGCYLCGYNGERYYQPDTHPCAKMYHDAQLELNRSK